MELDDPFEATTKAFLEWLAAAGVRVNPKMALVDLRSEGRGRGVVAGGDFDEDEVVFSIPRSVALNVKTALDPVEHLEKSILALPSWLALTTIMIAESQRKDSKWAPYLAVLPRNLDCLIFWSDAELAELQSSSVVNKIGKAKAEQMFSENIRPLDLENFDSGMCHRVASVIMAYAFDIPEEVTTTEEHGDEEDNEDDLVSDNGEDEKTILSMVPLADMLNADADRNNARLCSDNEELEMRTIKPILKGEEILNDYGQLPQSDLLRRYGYVTEHYSPYNVAEISTSSILNAFRNESLTTGHPLAPLSQDELQRRVEIAEREGVYEESYDVCNSGPDGPSIPDELLALLYILLIDDENMLAIQTSRSSLPSRSQLTNELAGQVLVRLLELTENEYATTLEEDEQLLQSGQYTGRGLLAVQVRLGEKRVLRNAIAEATKFGGSNKRLRLAQNSQNENGIGKRRAGESTNPNKKGRFR